MHAPIDTSNPKLTYLPNYRSKKRRNGWYQKPGWSDAITYECADQEQMFTHQMIQRVLEIANLTNALLGDLHKWNREAREHAGRLNDPPDAA